MAGSGNDTIDGGSKVDRLVYDMADWGNDRVQNFDASGNDYLDFRGSGLPAGNLILTQVGTDVTARFVGDAGSNVLSENMTVAALDGTDWLS